MSKRYQMYIEMERMRKDMGRLVVERDELVAALKQAISEIIKHVPFEMRDIRPYTDAIAKATGGAK